MNKLLVDVFAPCNGRTYDFWLEPDTLVSAAKAIIAEFICEAENRTLSLSGNATVIADSTIGVRLNDARTLYAEGVRSGHRLVIV